jgi:hypothetical protein
MSFSSGFQLSLELTNVFGVARQGVQLAKDFVNLARDLRQSGSDILVEEDLAGIFGRGRIDSQLEKSFKSSVSKDTSRTNLYTGSAISLHAGAGPTVSRALLQKEVREYLSTVIQLSFLSWLHDKEALAISLTQCMEQRMRMRLPGATPAPGFDSILGTLNACNSQTSSFLWTPYISDVKGKIQRHFSYYNDRYIDRHLEGLSDHLLLAAMDYFCLVQSLPEDRIMDIGSEEGVIPVVVWAHHILGLTVSIRSPLREDLVFGDARSPQVIVHWLDKMPTENQELPRAWLLDRSMNVVLRTNAELPNRRISAEERHTLRNYGSSHLRHALNKCAHLAPDSQVFEEVIALIVALTLLASTKVERGSDGKRMASPTRKLETWQILEAAQVIFEEFEYYKKEDILGIYNTIKDQPWSQFKLPRSAKLHLEKDLVGGNKADLSDFCSLIKNLSDFLLVFSYVRDVQSCAEVPLAFSRSTLHKTVVLTLRDGGDRADAIDLQESTLFMTATRFLTGKEMNAKAYKSTFLISDFGWSIYLDCIGDNDPANVFPEALHVKKGVPTNEETNEQKMRIEDAPIDRLRILPGLEVMDRGETYLPRCATQVTHRAEYFASRGDKFILSIRFKVNGHNTQGTFDVPTSYRGLHAALWKAHLTKPCEHTGITISESAKLGPDTVTVKVHSNPRGSMHLPERIIIGLVKGDQRLRWLAILGCVHSWHLSRREAMLRSDECCENCALDAAASQPGKWCVII